jgi:hypothetical protein
MLLVRISTHSIALKKRNWESSLMKVEKMTLGIRRAQTLRVVEEQLILSQILCSKNANERD